MSFLEEFKKTMSQREEDYETLQTNIRAGIGSTYIDFAIVDNTTSLVATTIVGFADTSKNPTCAEMGFTEHHFVAIGATYRGEFANIKNWCLVRPEWKYTDAGGFFDPVDYTEAWTKGLRETRDKKLAESDWTQSAIDSTLSSDKKTEWATYRQALRDLPANTTDLANPPWPTKPS
tara:strand:- start:4511 stop:5038 length:528 start_codon:yes stop_codon:yes gene_type:complete